MPITEPQLQLLSFCRIDGISWYFVAREAMRPDGLTRLLRAETTEMSKESEECRQLLKANLSKLDELKDEVLSMTERALSEGVRLTTVVDEDYPLNLRTIFNRPPFLFYRGNLDQDRDAQSVAVVGTREASDEGVKRARKMATALTEKGVTVLSGLARGIDTAAHEATLEANGRTIAVLGSGIRRIYPSENEKLAQRITETGAVVSQFWPDASPARFTFPRRNITMSGMGQGTVVIEASATSGAKMQARLALEHGKKVFLIDSLVSKFGWAANYHKKRGAIRVEKVEDILNFLRPSDHIRAVSRQSQRLQLSLDL